MPRDSQVGGPARPDSRHVTSLKMRGRMETAKRVLFSGDIFVAQTHGGVSRYFANLHSGLQGVGMNSWIAAPLHWNDHLHEAGHPAGRFGIARSMYTRRLAKVLASAAAYASMRRSTETIYHPTYYSAPFPPRGMSVVVTVYDMIHERYPTMFSGSSWLAKAKRRWCERADIVLAISETTRRDIIAFMGIDPEKVVVTPLGVCAAVPSGNARHDRPFFLFVGARRGYKKFDSVLEAMALIGQSERPDLVAFGGPPFDLDEAAQIASLGLAARVTHETGSDGWLAAHYRDASALLVPSLYEGFGLPVLEAMAAGCPVVAARTSALEEVGGDAALFFAPGEATELEEAMRMIREELSVREQYVVSGRRRAQMFSWTNTVEATYRYYERVEH